MSGKQLQVSQSLQEASNRLAEVIGINPLEPVFRRAEVVIAVRKWLEHPEVMEKIGQLKGTPSGFMTDEASRGPYDSKTVAIAVTDALSSGFQLVGNEFNIIAGKMMGVLNGYYRLVRTWQNDTHRMAGTDVLEGDITVNGNLVKIPMTVEYTLENLETREKTKHTFHRVIQVRQRGQNDTPDAWIGKASRRILKKLHVYLTGQDFGDDLGDESTAGSGPAQASSVPPEGKVDLRKQKPAKSKEQAEEADWTPVGAGAPESEAPKKEKATRKSPEPPPQPPGDVF